MAVKKKHPTREEAIARLPKGRPPGAKNRTTLFKEAMRGNFEDLLMKNGQKVFEAVVEKAIGGDMQAAKLLMDRLLPTTKAIDLEQLEKSQGLSISINIGSLEDKAEQILDAEVVEVEDGD